MDELGLVGDQLWPGCHPPDYLISDGRKLPSGWVEIESHRIMGRRGRADLIIPLSNSVAARALPSYSHLRPIPTRIPRLAAAAALGSRLIRPRRTIVLAAREGVNATITPVLSQLSESLGSDLSAVMHVRRTANRKALLQLVDGKGITVGFAKIARDAMTSQYVRNEAAALRLFDGGDALVRTPRLIAEGEARGYPYVVTEPLPFNIRAVRGDSGGAPSIAEYASIAPISRWAVASQTEHVRGLRVRSSSLDGIAAPAHLEPLTELLDYIDSVPIQMPVAERFHGDLSFWNVGRTPSGTLWCWDFEGTENDALAGLDIVHWYASRRRAREGVRGLRDRPGILADSSPTLTAFGIASANSTALVFSLYIAEIVTRTLEMAAADGWSHVWCGPADVMGLLADASESS